MIIDSFIFGLEHECDLIELRLDYLNDLVDYFVLAEASFTHTGAKKEFFFEKHKDRYKKYLDKIIYVKVEDIPDHVQNLTVKKAWGNVEWKYEYYHRSQVTNGWKQLSLAESDIILMSDVDEIPSKETIKYYSEIKRHHMPIRAMMDAYFYKLNLKSKIRTKGTVFCTRDFALEHGSQGLRTNPKIPYTKKSGGWHFTYLGDANAVYNKINCVSEHGFHDKWKNLEVLETAIQNRTIHCTDEVLTKIDVNVEKPFIESHILQKYPHLLA